MSFPNTRVALLLLAALAAFPSIGRFGNGFVFDDQAMIVEGEVIHDLANLPRAWTSRTMFVSARDDGTTDSVDTYRPLSVTTFFMDAAWSGRSPFGYHLTNLLLHVACTWLLFFVSLRLWPNEERNAAFVAAAFFATHPWLVEAHVWINGRSDPLALALVLAAAWVWSDESLLRRAPWAALLLFGALLAKETALLLMPAWVLLPTAKGWPSRRAWLTRGAVAGLMSSGYLALRVHVLEGARVGDEGTLAAAARTLPRLLADAWCQAGWPHGLALRSLRDEYAHGATFTLLVAGASLVAVVALGRRVPRVWNGLLWFFAPLVPVAVIATVLWPGFGRYLYLSMPGLAWVVATGWQALCGRTTRGALAAAGGWLAIASLRTALFTSQFASDQRLYEAAVEAHPDSPMASGFLGMELAKQGDHEAAIPWLEQAVLADPETHRYLARLGQALVARGRLEDAAAIAALGTERFANRPEEATYHMLAVQALTEPQPDVVADHLVRCLEVWPGRPDCLRAIGAVGADRAHAEAFRARASSSPAGAEVESALTR